MNYDILSIEENASVLKCEASRLSASKKSKIERFGVRRFEGGRMFQTSRLGPAPVERLITDTKEWGGLGTTYDSGFAPARTDHRKVSFVDENVLESYKETLNFLSNKFPDFVFNGECGVTNSTTSMKSSYGLDLSMTGGVCEWYFAYQRKGSGNMIDGFIEGKSAKPNIQQAVDEHLEFIYAHGKMTALKNGTVPVVFMDATAPLKKLKESFMVNKYQEGSALYSKKLGEKLFDSKISLIDRSYDPSHGLLGFFDGEGIVRDHDLNLIDQGKFQSTISDIRFGKKYGTQSTGNGLRPYNRGINLMFNSLQFKKGTTPWRQIVKNLDQCIVAFVAVGGDSNDLGEFSTPVQIGYVLEKGVVVGQAPQVTLKTSIDNYLGKNLIDVSSDGFLADSTSACVISEVDILVN